LYTVHEPLGTVGLTTPWNYPIAIRAWKIAPALATGNTVVFKPASQAPSVAAAIVECLDPAGVPDSAINFVTGSGREVAEPITTHPNVDAISFTGSSAVRDTVYEAASADQKRIQTEMGGKNPTVVTESADIETTTEIVGTGAFGVTGQACTACSRAIVYSEVYDEFVEAITEYAEGLTIGDGADAADTGPQVTEAELSSTLEYIDLGQQEGARLLAGGSDPSGSEYIDGY